MRAFWPDGVSTYQVPLLEKENTHPGRSFTASVICQIECDGLKVSDDTHVIAMHNSVSSVSLQSAQAEPLERFAPMWVVKVQDVLKMKGKLRPHQALKHEGLLFLRESLDHQLLVPSPEFAPLVFVFFGPLVFH